MSIKWVIVIWLLFSLAGCTTTQSVSTAYVHIVEQLEPGDRIEVHQSSGSVVDMQLMEIRGNLLIGQSAAAPFEQVEVNINQIRGIKTEKINPVITTLGVAGALLFIVPVAFLGGSVGIDWE